VLDSSTRTGLLTFIAFLLIAKGGCHRRAVAGAG
jgi:hypothetical protein